MSDTWNDIQAVKNRQSSLREKRDRWKKIYTNIAQPGNEGQNESEKELLGNLSVSTPVIPVTTVSSPTTLSTNSTSNTVTYQSESRDSTACGK